jgi:hypothetical protein
MGAPFEWGDPIRLSFGGHRLFRCKKRDRWAIADESGPVPEQTDDGILWLKFPRPIRVTQSGSFLTVVDDDNLAGSVPVSIEEVVRLVMLFEYEVELVGGQNGSMLFRHEP